MLKKFFSSELGKGTIILFITMNIFNLFNFLFHFSMGRMLGPANYGILAVLLSLIYIYSAPTEAIQNIISRYTSKFNLKKEYGKMRFLLYKVLKKGFRISFILFLILIIPSFFLFKFIQVNFWLILLTNLLVFASFSIPAVRGVLQGQKKFSFLGSSFVIESGLKLFFGISLVILGLKVFGAVVGILLGAFTGFVFSLYFNKDVLQKEEKKTSFPEIYPKSTPYFITILVVLLVFSIDIILAKKFFSPELAGQYAVLSMLGKIIFFGTIAVSKAMFPLASENHENNKSGLSLLKKSFLIVISLCIVAILIYAFLPKLVIGILYGGQYLEMWPYLVYSGIAMSFLSLSNLVLIYGLSTHKLRKSYYLFSFLIIEIVLFCLFHSTILEYILAFMVSNIIMFIGTLFFIKKWLN